MKQEKAENGGQGSKRTSGGKKTLTSFRTAANPLKRKANMSKREKNNQHAHSKQGEAGGENERRPKRKASNMNGETQGYQTKLPLKEERVRLG